MINRIERAFIVLHCKVVAHRVNNRVPIHAEDPLIVLEDTSRNLVNVVHDRHTSVMGHSQVHRDLFLAILAQGSHLWHIRVIENVERFWHDMHESILRQWRRVGITH